MFNVLFVTSFAPDMYRATGAHLVTSFLESETDGSLLVCHEGNLEEEVRRQSTQLLTYDLDGSDFLRDWLDANGDVIPGQLGGNARPCACPEPENPFGIHAAGCAWAWFNKNASRWFRKIVSLDYALALPGYDALIWIDSDCRFRERVPREEIASWFQGADMFYLKSPGREVIESGVIGFRTNDGGRRVLLSTIEGYRSGRFRKDLRWDDGYQFQLAVGKHPEIACVDLATRASAEGDVVANSPIGRYLCHWKGLHGYILKLMT